jgi:hypothetical protein
MSPHGAHAGAVVKAIVQQQTCSANRAISCNLESWLHAVSFSSSDHPALIPPPHTHTTQSTADTDSTTHLYTAASSGKAAAAAAPSCCCMA